MAKLAIVGKAAVLTSTLKMEDLRTIAKYRPEALKLKGGEDGKDVIFAVGIAKEAGHISEYGICFDGETRNNDKFATVTVHLDGNATGDITEYAADAYGAAMTNLGKLEATLPAVLTEIAAEKQAVMANISIA